MGKPIGFMFFSSKQPDTYRDAHVELYLQIAGQLAVIVEKGRLYQQLVELNELKNKFLGLRLTTSATHRPGPELCSAVSGRVSRRGSRLTARGAVQDGQACEGMLTLINDLLDVNAIESGHLELKAREVNLTIYLQESLAENTILAQAKSIELVSDSRQTCRLW